MQERMIKAKPVWIKGKERERNLCVSFRTKTGKEKGNVVLRIAASSIYNAYINGQFLAYGPARACFGHFRVDEIDITPYLTKEENVIAIDVAGYNADSFYVMNQPSFLQAEMVIDGNAVLFTGKDFECILLKEKVQRVQRYSFQRPFAEAYELDETYFNFKTGTGNTPDTEELVETPPVKLLKRDALYPQYEKTPASGVVSSGKTDSGFRPRPPCTVFTEIRSPRREFNPDELAVYLSDDANNMKFIREIGERDLQNGHDRLLDSYDLPQDGHDLPRDSYLTVSFPKNISGKITFDVETKDGGSVYCLFDEILRDDEVDVNRLGCTNVVRFDLKPGCYKLQTFEIYTMKYLKIVSVGSACTISGIHIVEYKHPPVDYQIRIPEERTKLKLIYDAAIETYRQNAVDLYTDCPSRERAGWLCDSFFLGRVEKLLTGDCRIERSFLENYLLPETFEFLPDGMFPMCYPGDFSDHNYIPNWAMWLVLELKEYAERSGDIELIRQFRDKVYHLIDFFKKYENEDGLLENLEEWVFVEWSKANDLVQDVNYPTNMLYSKMLMDAGHLYKDETLIQKADSIRKTVREKSYNGTFFTDNAVRKDGVLVNTNEATEVCQYYAFFCDIATPAEYPALWDALVRDFGPERKETGKYPEVYFANAFIGNYLRLDILLRYGYKEKVLENIEGYFCYMAEKTGTLWEHDGDYASCNHGFASHVLVWLDQIWNG